MRVEILQVRHVGHPTWLELGDLVVLEVETFQVRHISYRATGKFGDTLTVEIKRRACAGFACLEHRLIRFQSEGARCSCVEHRQVELDRLATSSRK